MINKNSAAWIRLFVLISVCAAACVTTKKQPNLSLDTKRTPESQPSASQQLKNLQKLTSSNTASQEIVQDVTNMLTALALEENGSEQKSMANWRLALSTATGAFGERAFIGWLKSVMKDSTEKQTASGIAKKVFIETSGGNISPWMISRDLTSEQNLEKYILVAMRDFLDNEPPPEGSLLNPPTHAGIPAADPILASTAKDVCKYGVKLQNGWREWKQSLSKDVNGYFEGLVLQCSGQTAKAVERLLDVGSRLAGHDATAHLALEAYSRVIKLKRDAGERDTVAPLFQPLMRIWKNSVLSEASFNLTPEAFYLRRIDDALGASRHQALINNVEISNEYAEDAAAFVKMAQSQPWAISADIKAKLAGDLAESYHLRAFRLALEARDWNRAIALTKAALQTESLSQDWTLRLQWSLGLYEYLANNYEAAQRRWDQMLTDNTDESYRPMLLYWLSRSHAKRNNTSERDFYRKTLVKDHPLSFYTVVGLEHDDIGGDTHWYQNFGDRPSLEKRLTNWDRDEFDSLRRDAVRGRLLKRAEILVSAKVGHFSLIALDELQRSLDLAAFDEKSVKEALYASRLYAAAGQWQGSQAMTTKLMRSPKFWDNNPEQLLVYFPRPWSQSYERAASIFEVPIETLLAVTRQETAFKADAKSPANAYGLMQFTPATAKRFAVAAGVKLERIPASLYHPETNIQLGAAFLKHLATKFSDRDASIYLSYNAGEQASESWASRRSNEDPMLAVELIPYTETRSYVKNVWRNKEVYGFLLKEGPPTSNHKSKK
ncbi:MAG: lytic transglycosylase domain-containing protein [Proteobacteria bacterium]|nr:lytic transglycosylase domain-containing protein [Pseudomonadota bacterium]